MKANKKRMRPKHTPGPWAAYKIKNRFVITEKQTPVIVAAIEKTTGGWADEQEAKANARLIAEAPLLLNALRVAVGCLEESNADPKLVIKIKAVIAQASGEEEKERRKK